MKREVPTIGEMVESCAKNRDIAEQQMDATRARMRREPPGPERDSLRVQLSRYKAEYEHWANYVSYYLGRASREGKESRPSMVWRMDAPAEKPMAPVIPLRPQPMEPMEIAEDDIPF
ncbi:MAG TPA: hypothetical protein VD948_06280 [Rhodothermales bacterium]|nr:hypothetical protein [Rhodothermales bacterium]